MGQISPSESNEGQKLLEKLQRENSRKIFLGDGCPGIMESDSFFTSRHIPEYETIFWAPNSLPSEIGLTEKINHKTQYDSAIQRISERTKEIKKDFLNKNGKLIILCQPVVPVTHGTFSSMGGMSVSGVTQLLDYTFYKIASPKFKSSAQIKYNGPLHEVINDTLCQQLAFHAVLESKSIKPLFLGKFSDDVVGGYYLPPEGGIILYAPLWNKVAIGYGLNREYLSYLTKLDLLATHLLQNKTAAIELPSWAAEYCLPLEQEARTAIHDKEKKIDSLSGEIDNHKKIIQEQEDWKRLFTAYDSSFEKIVKKALEELGCKVEHGPKSHGDLVANYQDQLIIVEAKGINASANKGHVTQCSGWVDELVAAYSTPEDERDSVQKKYCEIIDQLGFSIESLTLNDQEPKGLLILNTYKETPLEKRENAYPDNIQKLLKQKSLCGLTGVQLLGCLIQAWSTPEDSKVVMQKILESQGVFFDHAKYQNFLK